MKKLLYHVSTLFLFIALLHEHGIAGGCLIAYKYPAKNNVIYHHQTITEASTDKNKTVRKVQNSYEYTFTKNSNDNWVKVAARIRPIEPEESSPFDWSNLEYSAEMNSIGKTRNILITRDSSISHTVVKLPDFEAQLSSMASAEGRNLAAQMNTMMKNQLNIINESQNSYADNFKSEIFWFPELPKKRLFPGDVFESKKLTYAGNPSTTIHTKTVSLYNFTINKVTKGMAYVSFKVRSKTDGIYTGAQSKTTTSGKGTAIFDIKRGMWLEFSEKVKVSLTMPIPGIKNNTYDLIVTGKYQLVE